MSWCIVLQGTGFVSLISPASVPSDSCAVELAVIHRLVGLVVKVFASGVEDPGFESRLRRDFSESSHTSDFKIGNSSGYPARRLVL